MKYPFKKALKVVSELIAWFHKVFGLLGTDKIDTNFTIVVAGIISDNDD